MRILLTDGLAEEGIEILVKQGHDVNDRKVDAEHLPEAVKGYNAMIVRSRTKVTKEVIERMDGMRVIGRAGVGIDNIDAETAYERGIYVTNAPNGNTIAAAELAVGLMLTIGRNIAHAYSAMAQGTWAKKHYQGTELYRKTMGIIGCGKIGSAVAERLKGFDADIIVHDPCYNSNGYRREDLDTLLTESDFVTIHTPRLEKPVIGQQQLQMMKSTAYLINTSRGGNVDETALYTALKQGTIAGAALDVFKKEGKDGEIYQNPLLKLPNFVGLPHLGASTEEAQKRTAVEIAEKVIEYLR